MVIFSAGAPPLLGFVGRQLAKGAGTWPVTGTGKVDFLSDVTFQTASSISLRSQVKREIIKIENTEGG